MNKSKIKILLTEDDVNLGTILKEYLEVKDFDVSLAHDGIEAEKLFNSGDFDLCIFDVMMPKKDGFSLAQSIRKKDESTPIIFLTAKSMLEDKLEGLKLGADDYITKPFSTEELLLRIKAVMKRVIRNNQTDFSEEFFEIGSYYFDSTRRILIQDGIENKLTSKENELLKLLCQNRNNVLDRSTALVNIWKDDNYFNSRSMDVYITRLRNYLKNDPAIEISNVHGQGYKLITP